MKVQNTAVIYAAIATYKIAERAAPTLWTSR